MKVENLFNMNEEEKNSYPFTSCFIDSLKEFYEKEHFDEREELQESIEEFLVSFSGSNIDFIMRMIMLGQIPFPLPNELDGWTDEDFDIIHKRYKKLKKMNRLSREN